MMRVLRLLVFFLPLLTACSGGQKKVEKSPEPVGKVVVITDSLLLHGGSDTLRLGRMGSGELARVALNLKNDTSQPMVLLGEERTCGCIELIYENEPIMPTKYLPMAVDFDSRGLYGWQLKLFYLHLYGAEVPLKIYVEVELE